VFSSPTRAGLRPQFTLVMLYVFAFFFAFALAIALPDLLRALRELPPDSNGDPELASRIARDALRGRLSWAFGAAVAATALGAKLGALPGLRR
jgi:hypothetical protein